MDINCNNNNEKIIDNDKKIPYSCDTFILNDIIKNNINKYEFNIIDS